MNAGPLPAQIGPYTVARLLGHGGMGVVYEVTQPGSKRSLALKLLTQLGTRNLEERARLAREAEALARLRHPHVVRVHAADLAGPRPYLVQELLAGESLQQTLDREGPLPVARALEITHKLAAGLAHAHAQGVLHRDLKPANALCDERGEPKLVDFGLASVAGASPLTETGTVMGTPAYMAPEQAFGDRELDARADVYGLGALLFALLTGQAPFAGPGGLGATLLAVTQDPPPKLRALRPDAPAWLEDLCRRALAKSPDDRPESAAAFQLALQEAGGTATRSTRRWLIAAATLVTVAVGGALASFNAADRTNRPSPPPTSVLPSPPTEIDWEGSERALRADVPEEVLDLLGPSPPAGQDAERWRRLRANALLLQGDTKGARELWAALGPACRLEEFRLELAESVRHGPGELGWPPLTLVGRVDHKRVATPLWLEGSEGVLTRAARLKLDLGVDLLLRRRAVNSIAEALQACHQEIIRDQRQRVEALLRRTMALTRTPELEVARAVLDYTLDQAAPEPVEDWPPAQQVVVSALDYLQERVPAEEVSPSLLGELPPLSWLAARAVEHACDGLSLHALQRAAEALWAEQGAQEDRIAGARRESHRAERYAQQLWESSLRREGQDEAYESDTHVPLVTALLFRGESKESRKLLIHANRYGSDRDEQRRQLLLAECELLDGDLEAADVVLSRLQMNNKDGEEIHVDPYCARAALRALGGDTPGAQEDLETRVPEGLWPYLPWRSVERTLRALEGDDLRALLAASPDPERD